MILNRALVIILAYLAASAFVGPVYALATGSWDLWGGLMLTPMTVTFALPGFVILRFALAWFRQVNAISFAIAGLLNGVGASIVFLREVPPPLVVAGLVAGLVYFAVEHKALGSVISRPQRKAA